MARAAGRLVSACALVMLGCGGGPAAAPAPSSGCFTGDPSSPPAVTLVGQTSQGTLAPVADGGTLPLVAAPQGGEVLVVGVRALNVDGCPLTLSTSLALASSGLIAAFERRPVMLQPAADGWLEPKNPAGLANFANVPACPIAGLGQAVDGEPYVLTVQVEDPAGRQAQASATVVPTCDASPDPVTCRCLCSAGYVLGQRCS